MMTWLRQWATRCHGISDVRMKTAEKIPMGKLPTFSLILILLIGVACAFLSTWLPNITNLFFGAPRRQWLTADPQSGFHLQLTDFHVDTPSTLKVSRDMQGESQAAVNLGREMMSQGRMDKAHKLFQHAVALDPNHPDVLNELGEFLEKTQRDIVLAEHMYTKAITANPTHSKALINRKRTLPLVEEIDQNTFNRIEKKREDFFKVPENSAAMKRMKKESYFRHIYHTNAIEGNTFTLSQTRALVETRIAIGGKSIMEHNEILGMDCALSFINNTLVYRVGQMTVADILEIHKRVLGFVDPVEAGTFRNHQVFVGEHVPPAASDIEVLMEEFVEWLNSEDALNLNPIELAALAHYRLVYIHPFYDGNGRTSRLLMNLILMRAGYPPVIIRKEEKHEYYKHLETANKGDVRPFIRFIAKCTERMLDEYLWVTSDRPNSTLVSLSRYRDDGRTIIVDRP